MLDKRRQQRLLLHSIFSSVHYLEAGAYISGFDMHKTVRRLKWNLCFVRSVYQLEVIGRERERKTIIVYVVRMFIFAWWGWGWGTRRPLLTSLFLYLLFNRAKCNSLFSLLVCSLLFAHISMSFSFFLPAFKPLKPIFTRKQPYFLITQHGEIHFSS